MKYSLKDSFIYDIFGLDKAVDAIASKINPKIKDFVLDDTQMAAIISDIRNKSTGLNKNTVIKHLQDGEVLLVNTPGISLPAWCMVSSTGKVVAVVNVANKISISRAGILTYQVREIFGAAVLGSVLRSFYINEKRFIYNPTLVRNMGIVYTRIILRLIDAIFSVNAVGNERESHLIEFLIVKFYLRRVLERTQSQEQEVTSILSIMSQTRAQSHKIISGKSFVEDGEKFPDEIFANFNTFAKALAESIPSLKSLETNVLIRKMIMSLGEKSALMLESPHYLFALVASSAMNSNLIKDYQLVSITGNDLLNKCTRDIMSMDVE